MEVEVESKKRSLTETEKDDVEERLKKPLKKRTNVHSYRHMMENYKTDFENFLRDVVDVDTQPKAARYISQVESMSVEDLIEQFSDSVLPLKRLGLLDLVIRKILDKVKLKKEDLYDRKRALTDEDYSEKQQQEDAKKNYAKFKKFVGDLADMSGNFCKT